LLNLAFNNKTLREAAYREEGFQGSELLIPALHCVYRVLQACCYRQVLSHVKASALLVARKFKNSKNAALRVDDSCSCKPDQYGLQLLPRQIYRI